MRIDRIESLNRRKSKVFLDGDFAFVLYNGEIARFRLAEGGELEEERCREILTQIVGPRAREKALDLLKVSDRTELEMKRRLLKADFPEETVRETLEFLKEYGYLDDRRYAENYVELHSSRKSLAEMRAALGAKGIPSALVKELYRSLEADGGEAVREILRKRHYDPETASPDETRKTAAYLMRRGFAWEEVRGFLLHSD